MEASQQAVTEEGSSQTRSPKRKRKQATSTDTLQDKRCRVANPVEPRRSLRILAKQKLREEQAKKELSLVQVSSEKQEKSQELSKSGKEAEKTKKTESIGRGKGKGRKRKRTSSPCVSSPPKKQAKKGKTGGKAQSDTGDSKSCSRISDTGDSRSCSRISVVQAGPSTEGTSATRQSRRKQSKEELCVKGNTSNRERESVIVDATSARKKRTRKASSSTETDKQSTADLRKKGRSKSRSCKSRGKSRATEERVTISKGKGRGNWSSTNYCSLPSLVDFTKLNMASPDDKDTDIPTGEGTSNTEGASGSTPSNQDGANNQRGKTGESSGSDRERDVDPFSGLDEGNRRLHAMMEERGLPHHLLGALGSRMHYMMQKSFSSSISSSNNSRAQQLLTGLEAVDDEGLQLQSCIETGQLLVMGNEDTLSGFPVKQAVPALVKLLSMEHNFDMMMNACRALTYMMEALPRSSMVVAHAIPVLIEKLQVIQCMDVAEQALSALEILSKRHGKPILQAGGLNACLLYLDFFSIGPQRSALSIASNCCQTVTEDDFTLIQDALPILSGRLQHQDKRSVESCCLCFSRLVDSFASNKRVLQDLATPGLLSNLQQLLVISPPIISSSMFVSVLKMMSTFCASCPLLAVQLLRLNVADTLRYLLVGSGEITLENIELMTRSPNEVYEILSLTSELMPVLPKDGIFEVEEWMTVKKQISASVQWEWQESGTSWRPYGRIENRIIEATYQSHEEECSIAILGNTYIIDLSGMQQINEDTGTTRAVRRTTLEPPKNTGKEGMEQEDERSVALREDPALGTTFVQALFGVLYEVFNSMAGPAVRIKCLKTILRILYHAESSVLTDILKDISVSSHLATMLKAQDYRLVVGAMQMAEVLLQKLPDIFTVYFHREGVIHQLQILKDNPLKTLATPTKQEPATLPPPAATTSVSVATSEPQTPPSTKKRLSEIFKKGKRHFRKTLRGRSDEQDSSSSASNSSSSVTTPPVSEKKSLPTLLPYPALLPSAGGGSGTSGEGTVKERVQQWIQQQAAGFLDKWVGPASSNPAQQVVSSLKEAASGLDPKSAACLTSLNSLCEILTKSDSNVSAFEFMHCKMHSKLFKFLTLDSPQCQHSLNIRLRHFLQVFMGLPVEGVPLSSWVEQGSTSTAGMTVLLSKLHGCVNQLEQFPVRVHDLPGRRGSQALKFFNSHQIKCALERHPSAVDTNQWKGGILRIDPLATVQTLERYMIIRGFGKPSEQSSAAKSAHRADELDSEDSEVDESMIIGLSAQSTEKHCIEFLIGDQPLPYNMTIFQAIKQHGLESGHQDGEEEIMPLGRPEIWVRAHTLSYRTLPSGGENPSTSSYSSGHRSYSVSLPPTPLGGAMRASPPLPPPSTSRKQTWSGGGTTSVPGKRRISGGKLPPLPTGTATPSRVTRSNSGRNKPQFSVPDPPMRVTRSSTAPLPLPQAPGGLEGVVGLLSPKEKKTARLSPLHQALQDSTTFEIVSGEQSTPILRLLKALYALNIHWTDLYPGLAGNPILPTSEFINNKLTAKATRQLQDPLNVITGNFPSWLHHLASNCMFLFPFECRQTLFYLSTFDRDRAIARLHDQQPDMNTGDSSQTVAPRFEKKKRCVSRENLLEQAEKLMDELASNKALLEIHYQDEVGTGLGPTLEFYALVSRELQRSDLMLFRGDLCLVPGSPVGGGASSTPQYIHSPVGVFPAPLGPSTPFSVVEEVCSKFRFLGKLMAKAIMDSRMLDLPLSEAFYKWMLNLEDTFTAQDLQHVDPIVARSFAQLAAVALKKHSLENDPLLTKKALVVGIEALTLEGGGSVDDLDLDFTLPGYPYIELKPGGRDIAVTVHNLDDYLKLVVDWTLVRGVARQMEAFKDGFNTVFPLSSLYGLLYPSEMDMMICGAHLHKWDIKDLMEYCRPDHGYSHDSRAIQYLFEVLSDFDTVEQRQFIQFVTGSPRLPVGGFKALNPQLTIVRKTVEPPLNPDDFLPSVMTCVNYLKLPDYSAVAVMKERLSFALQEGKHSFHLS